MTLFVKRSHSFLPIRYFFASTLEVALVSLTVAVNLRIVKLLLLDAECRYHQDPEAALLRHFRVAFLLASPVAVARLMFLGVLFPLFNRTGLEFRVLTLYPIALVCFYDLNA